MLKERNFTSEILKLAVPLALGQAGHIMVGIADSVMVGNLGGAGGEEGKIALAAASLANGLYAIVLVFGLGLTFGITPPVANASGAGDRKKITSLLRSGTLLSMLAGFILFAILGLLSPLLGELGQPVEVVEQAIPYFNIMLFSMVPLMLFMSSKQFSEGLSFTFQATVISIAANLLNIFLNYLLIYGNWGFPELGLLGAGWASFISRVIMAVMMVMVIIYHKDLSAFRQGFLFRKTDWQEVKKLMKIGVPIGFQLTFEVGAFAFAAVMIGWLGAAQLAAHQIALSLAAVTYMLASGIGSAATVKVGQYFGVNDREAVVKSTVAAAKLVIIFMISTGLIFILLREFLPSLFNKDPQVIALAASLLVIAALFQLSDGLQVVAQGALRGLSDVNVPTLIAFFSYFVVGLPVAYLFGFVLDWGAKGVWWGLLTGLTLSATLQLVRFRKQSSIKV